MPNTDEQALNRYIEAIAGEVKSVVCVRHIEGFAAEFELRYHAWREANAEALAQGARIADARGMNAANPPNLATFASMGAQILEALPEDDRQRRCDELLSFFKDNQPK